MSRDLNKVPTQTLVDDVFSLASVLHECSRRLLMVARAQENYELAGLIDAVCMSSHEAVDALQSVVSGDGRCDARAAIESLDNPEGKDHFDLDDEDSTDE